MEKLLFGIAFLAGEILLAVAIAFGKLKKENKK